MASIYDTNVLKKVVASLITPQSFFLDRYFPEVITSDTEYISFDVLHGKRRLAPFCSPIVEGKVVASRGFRTDTFKPAYIKDKRQFNPQRALKRAVGETIGGSMKPIDREKANLNVEMQDQLEMLTRRFEYMAIDALLDGKVTVSGEGFDTTQVDFGRDAGNTIALVNTARWGEDGVSPADDVEEWSTQILKASGAVPTEIIFDAEAWKLFKDDPKVEKALDLWRGGKSEIELGAQPKIGAQYKGRYGNFDLFVYVDWYVDESDVEHPMLPAYSVIMGGAGIEGVRHFGAIQDPTAGYQAIEYFPKSWVTDDPAIRWLMMQSAPLIVPARVNASLAATVR